MSVASWVASQIKADKVRRLLKIFPPLLFEVESGARLLLLSYKRVDLEATVLQQQIRCLPHLCASPHPLPSFPATAGQELSGQVPQAQPDDCPRD